MNPEIPTNGLTLILGGARSGKSSFAEQIGRESGGSVLFIATATNSDVEMGERIRNHQASRPSSWQTLEFPMAVGASLSARNAGNRSTQIAGATLADVVIVDCITLLVTNVIFSLPEDTPAPAVMQKVQEEIDELVAAQVRTGGQWLIVSNEVGLGLVPPYPLGRIYRDALGRANQQLARAAQRVIFLVAGIPTVIK